MLQMFWSLGGNQHHLLGCSVLGQQAENTNRLNKLIRGSGSVLGVAVEAPWYRGQCLLQPENHTELLSHGLRPVRRSTEGHWRFVLPEAVRLPPPFSHKLSINRKSASFYYWTYSKCETIFMAIINGSVSMVTLPVQSSAMMSIHLFLGRTGAHMGPGGAVHTAHWATVRWRSAGGRAGSELGSASQRHPAGCPGAGWTWILKKEKKNWDQNWRSERVRGILTKQQPHKCRIRGMRSTFGLFTSSCCDCSVQLFSA